MFERHQVEVESHRQWPQLVVGEQELKVVPKMEMGRYETCKLKICI